ncbi:MAG: DUF3368 domain-containing protein [Bacteroidota bacterium]
MKLNYSVVIADTSCLILLDKIDELDILNAILILDDHKARKTAEKLDLNYTGTFGILLRAKKLGIIKELKPITEKIKATNFRFSDELFHLLLKEAGEL